VGRGVELGRGVTVRGPGIIHIGNGARLCEGVILQAAPEIAIGDQTDINPFTTIYGQITMGSYVTVAPHVMPAGGNHPFDDLTPPMKLQGHTTLGIVTEDGVWIDANAVVADGIRIGKEAIVGAGAVAIEDVPSYAMMDGNSAKLIKYRPQAPVWAQVRNY